MGGINTQDNSPVTITFNEFQDFLELKRTREISERLLKHGRTIKLNKVESGYRLTVLNAFDESIFMVVKEHACQCFRSTTEAI